MASQTNTKRERDEPFFTIIFTSSSPVFDVEGVISIVLPAFFGERFKPLDDQLQDWWSHAMAIVLEIGEPMGVKQAFFSPQFWNAQEQAPKFVREVYKRYWFCSYRGKNSKDFVENVERVKWVHTPEENLVEVHVLMDVKFKEAWQSVANDLHRPRKQPRQEPDGLDKVFKLYDKVQERAVESIEKFREAGGKAGVLVMATGMGKTLTMCKHVVTLLRKKRSTAEDLTQFRFLFLVHRSAILGDACLTMKHLLGVERDERKSHIPVADLFDSDNPIPWSSNDFKFLSSDVSYQNQKWKPEKREEPPKFLFAMLQSIETHLGVLGHDFFHYVVMDEAHHNRAGEEEKGFERVFKFFNAKWFTLGLSATPYRMDGRNVIELFDEKNKNEKRVPGYISQWQLLEEGPKTLREMLLGLSALDIPSWISDESAILEGLPDDLLHWPVPCIAKINERFTLCCEKTSRFHPLVIADDIGQLLSCHEPELWSIHDLFVLTFSTRESLLAMFSSETILSTLRRSLYCFEIAVPAGLRAGLLCPVSYKFVCEPQSPKSVTSAQEQRLKVHAVNAEDENPAPLILESRILRDADRLVQTVVKIVSSWKQNPPYENWRPRALVFCESVAHAFQVMNALENRQCGHHDVEDLFGPLSVHAKFFVASSDQLQSFAKRNVPSPSELFPHGVGITLVCDKANEGVDIPECDVLVLARPTDNMIIYLQQLGRGLRRDPKQPKKKLLVIDMAGNIYRMWFIRKAIGIRRPSVKVLKQMTLVAPEPQHEEEHGDSDERESSSSFPTGSEGVYAEHSPHSEQINQLRDNSTRVPPVGNNSFVSHDNGSDEEFKWSMNDEDDEDDGDNNDDEDVSSSESIQSNNFDLVDLDQGAVFENDDDCVGFTISNNPGGQSDVEFQIPEQDLDFVDLQNVEAKIEEKLKQLEIDTGSYWKTVSNEYVRLFCASEKALLDGAAARVISNCQDFNYRVTFSQLEKSYSCQRLASTSCSWFGMMGIQSLDQIEKGYQIPAVSLGFLSEKSDECWFKVVDQLWAKEKWSKRDFSGSFKVHESVEKISVVAFNHIWWLICAERNAFQALLQMHVISEGAANFFKRHVARYLQFWGDRKDIVPLPSVAWAMLKECGGSVLDMHATNEWWREAAEYFGARDINLIQRDSRLQSERRQGILVKRTSEPLAPFSFFISERSRRNEEDDEFERRNRGEFPRYLRFANSKIAGSGTGFDFVVSFPPEDLHLQETDYAFLLRSRDWVRFLGGSFSQLGIQPAILHLLVAVAKLKANTGKCCAFLPLIALCQDSHDAAISWILSHCELKAVFLLPQDALGRGGVWRSTCILILHGRKAGIVRCRTIFVQLSRGMSLCESILQPSNNGSHGISSSKLLREMIQQEFKVSL